MENRKRHRSSSDGEGERSKITVKEDKSKKSDTATRCWPFILPHLPLADIVTLSEIPEISPSIDRYLSSGKKVTMDDHFIQKYPMSNNEDVYHHIGRQVKAIIVSGITQLQAKCLVEYFPAVTEFALHQMEIDEEESIKSYPKHYQSLKIVNCVIERNFLYRLFITRSTLESLHLDRLSFFSQSQSPVSFPRYALSSIRHLTLERMTMSKNHFQFPLRELSSLTLRATTGTLELPYDSNRLEKLVIDLDSRGTISFNDYQPTSFPHLQYLSIRYHHLDWILSKFTCSPRHFYCHTPPNNIETILSWTQLETVQIHCNWYHAEQLRNHFASLGTIKNVGITCCAPTAGYDLLSTLNEYCLREIVSYLDEEDLHKLPLVDPRFAALLSSVKIDEQFVKQYPLNKASKAFYANLAAHTTSLRVEDIEEGVFYKLMGHFKTLKKLTLFELTLKNKQKISVVPMVAELHIHFAEDCGMGRAYWGHLLCHLNPELRKLRLEGDVDKTGILKHLWHIEELYLDALHLHDSLDETIDFFWQNENLSHLDLKVAFCLDDEEYECNLFCIVQVLETVNRHSLRSLIIRYKPYQDQMFHQRTLHRIGLFANLEHLTLWKITADCYYSRLNAEWPLPKLKTFNVSVIRSHLLKALPKLETIRIEREGVWDAKMESELRNYLQQMGRRCTQNLDGDAVILTIRND